MTLVEVLIAIAILSGVMATAVETSRMAIDRSAIYAMEAEASARAESLLERFGEDLLLESHLAVVVEAPGQSGDVKGDQIGQVGKFRLVRVEGQARIERGGMAVQQRLTTLKLVRVP